MEAGNIFIVCGIIEEVILLISLSAIAKLVYISWAYCMTMKIVYFILRNRDYLQQTKDVHHLYLYKRHIANHKHATNLKAHENLYRETSI